MKEEIFGPLLAVLAYDQIEEALGVISRFEKPLSLYLFTRDNALEQRIISTVSFGGGCINDTLIHLANPNLPFGGVGDSGFGSYHGVKGFETFSHHKSVLKKSDRIDIQLRNPPFKDHLKLLKWIMK
jgi:aldehyde dehydrogenase (NAD+)